MESARAERGRRLSRGTIRPARGDRPGRRDRGGTRGEGRATAFRDPDRVRRRTASHSSIRRESRRSAGSRNSSTNQSGRLRGRSRSSWPGSRQSGTPIRTSFRTYLPCCRPRGTCPRGLRSGKCSLACTASWQPKACSSLTWQRQELGVAEFAESPRWQALAEIQRQYLRTLDSLELWDVQTVRLVAVKEKECRIEAEVVLIGMADMNRAMRQMLDQVESKVTSLVLAPSELADRFDSHGCLAPERWQEAIIDLADDQIALVDDPADQAAAAVRWIASLDGRYRGEDITLGVPDAQVLPHLEQYLAQAGVSARYGVGKPVAQSGPYRLLAGAADFLEDGRFSSLAAMLRNPAVQKWLEKKVPGEGWLTRLDEYYSSHLPYGLEDLWLDSGGDCGKHETAPEQPVRGRLKPGLQRGEDWRVLQRAREQIEALLEGFRGEQRPLGQWGQTVLDLLAAVFGTRKLDPETQADRSVLEACAAVREAIEGHRAIPGELAPRVGGAESIRIVLRDIGSETISALPDRAPWNCSAGWNCRSTMRPLLPSRASMKESFPSTSTPIYSCPTNCGWRWDWKTTTAVTLRDAYALSVLAALRERLVLIVGRRSAEGDPLAPSRLLFACDRETLARRSLRLFSAGDVATASFGRKAPLPGAAAGSRGFGLRATAAKAARRAGHRDAGHRVPRLHRLPVPVLPAASPAFAPLGRCGGGTRLGPVRHAGPRRTLRIRRERRCRFRGCGSDFRPSEWLARSARGGSLRPVPAGGDPRAGRATPPAVRGDGALASGLGRRRLADRACGSRSRRMAKCT